MPTHISKSDLDMKIRKIRFLFFSIILIILTFYVSSCKKQTPSTKINPQDNAYYFIQNLLTYDLETQLKKFPDILNYDYFIPPKKSLVGHYLKLLTLAKVFWVESIFLMIEGKKEKSLELIVSNYHLGSLLMQSNTIDQVIGIAVNYIAAKNLEIYALNCCETQEDFLYLWKAMEELNAQVRKPHIWEWYYLRKPISYFDQAKEVKTRHKVSMAKFQLVRLATAVKYYLVENGKFPQESKDFVLLSSEKSPLDPFSSKPLKFISHSDSMICYSIGPDKADDFAQISYDSTNGTISRGDIIVKIPKEREFPFPRDGVKASSAEEFRKLFPNGLPDDPFANYRNVPLSITNSTPVYVYSYGPDTDQGRIKQIGDSYIPTVHYDPTNGTTSDGDLFITIPQ